MCKRDDTGIGADATAAAGLLVLAFALVFIGAGLLGQWQDSAARHQRPEVEDVLGAAAAAAGAVLLLWWFVSLAYAAAGLVLEKLGKAKAAAVSRKMSPAFMQRLVVAAVSVQLLSGGVAAHAAVPAPGPQWAPTQGQESSAPAASGPDRAAPATGEQEAAPPPDNASEPSVPASPGSGPGAAAPVTGGSGPQPTSDPSPAPLPPAADQFPVNNQAPVPGQTEPILPAPSTIQPRWQPSAPIVEPGLLTAPDVRSDAGIHQGIGRYSGPVAVLAGDSLWDIVADQLGPGASDVDIALEWPRWYEANKTLLGQNPDVLLPGQILVPPTSA
ncbi:hypothetical protein DXK94_11520 [Arthrobacter sp. RT-1]|uniref:LysM peptidoglycan-binding domain-containing protein n=1 Tax=Arthrobacter sp. RT-1 TaxID=2292263 RepID=UPI000E1FA35F|nr:hypothetical protein [Arthrobacter sp. RT-1]RDV09552.1 hypothetical protein DXK94_11520 [Arthrobacter sp. RT-1]